MLLIKCRHNSTFDSENEKAKSSGLIPLITHWLQLSYHMHSHKNPLHPVPRPPLMFILSLSGEGFTVIRHLCTSLCVPNPNWNSLCVLLPSGFLHHSTVADKETICWYQELMFLAELLFNLVLLVLETGFSLLHKCCHAFFTIILKRKNRHKHHDLAPQNKLTPHLLSHEFLYSL